MCASSIPRDEGDAAAAILSAMYGPYRERIIRSLGNLAAIHIVKWRAAYVSPRSGGGFTNKYAPAKPIVCLCEDAPATDA